MNIELCTSLLTCDLFHGFFPKGKHNQIFREWSCSPLGNLVRPHLCVNHLLWRCSNLLFKTDYPVNSLSEINWTQWKRLKSCFKPHVKISMWNCTDSIKTMWKEQNFVMTVTFILALTHDLFRGCMWKTQKEAHALTSPCHHRKGQTVLVSCAGLNWLALSPQSANSTSSNSHTYSIFILISWYTEVTRPVVHKFPKWFVCCHQQTRSPN